MAVNPSTIKLAVSQAINIFSNEENISTSILFIAIIIAVVFFIILIPALLIFSPVDSMKAFLSSNEQIIVQDIQSLYRVDYGMGNITINSKFGFPLETIDKVVITAEYGMYDPWNTGTFTKHTGIDLCGIHRDNVLAVENGIVTFAGVQNGFGNCIELKHIVDEQEIYTFYAHLSAIGVVQGQEVEQGYIIGKEGGDPYTDRNAGNSTGHHLHFEVRLKSGYGNDINPKKYIFKEN